MLLSAIPHKTVVQSPNYSHCIPIYPYKSKSICSSNPSSYNPIHLFNACSSSVTNPKLDALRHVSNHTAVHEAGEAMVPSAAAVSSAIRSVSTSPVEFSHRMEKESQSGLVLPSPDFQRLCVEQLDLFHRIVHSNALLSVYVRPAGSYVMDRLELRRVVYYPGLNASDIVILIGDFSIPTGLRMAEAALSNLQVEVIPECRAVVFPMVKHPFVVGFLVVELPMMEREGHHLPSSEECSALSARSDSKSWDIQNGVDDFLKPYKFTNEQRANAINIARSLAMAYIMDQKATLLQQSSWQNNVRMSNLVEQIRGPLSSIRTLSKMLSIHLKRSEISYDLVEDILVQGERVRDTLQQLQDAVYLTKANIMRYNKETLKKIPHPESVRSQLSNKIPDEDCSSGLQKSREQHSSLPAVKDLEMPMPPLALAPLQGHVIRPCNVADVLSDLVGAIRPLAHKQERVVELSELSQPFPVPVEEPALRQALSNLIEGALLRTHVGGKVEIDSVSAPAGGVLVVIDDDGPDMHYMTQMHSLTPFGSDLFGENKVEDNMTWNFVAGLTVAREILESYGCGVRVISPRTTDAILGTGGTRIELWLPSSTDARR